MTLTEYRESIPMSIPELARRAGVDPQTIRNAENGQRISPRVAKGIAEALSAALGREITYRDIEGLDVRL
jgi:transcriptional regulator with XRE-family HTH domain